MTFRDKALLESCDLNDASGLTDNLTLLNQ